MGQKCNIWPLKVRLMNKFGPKWPIEWQLFLQEEIKYETIGSDVNIPLNMYYIWAIAQHFGTYCICRNSICKHAQTLTWFFVYIQMCQCASRKGSDETVRMLRRVWALTERICPMYAHFVHACVRAVKALGRLHTCSCTSEHWMLG